LVGHLNSTSFASESPANDKKVHSKLARADFKRRGVGRFRQRRRWKFRFGVFVVGDFVFVFSISFIEELGGAFLRGGTGVCEFDPEGLVRHGVLLLVFRPLRYFVAPNGEGGFGKAGVVGGGGVFTSEYVPIEES
jgi:hypothetical protein